MLFRSRDSYYVPDMEERAQVSQIVALRRAGLSYEHIASRLRRILRPNGRRWNKNSIRLAARAGEADFPKSHGAHAPRDAGAA